MSQGLSVQPSSRPQGAPGRPDRAALTLRTGPRPGDRERVREILLSTGMFHAREVEVALELVEDGLAKGPASEYFFLFAEQGGETVGYVCYGPITMTDGRFDLYWIVARKDAQRRGTGSLLLSEAERHAGEMGGAVMFAETSSRDDYAPTREFYLRRGYAEAATVRCFYAEDDHKIIYAKNLSGKSP